MSTPESKHSLRTRYNWIGLLAIACGVPIFSLWNYCAGSSSKQVTLMSAAISLAFLLPIMLWSFPKAHRNDESDLPKSMLVGAAFLGVLSFSVTWIGASTLKPHNGLLDLASSDTQLSDIEPERKRLVVELIRRKAANSQENDKAIAEARKHPMNPQIYTPESFASKEAMDSTVAQLATWINLDADYSNQQQIATDDFRKKMILCDPAYLKSFEESMQKREAADALSLQTESAWFAGVKALYSYAASNAAYFSVSDEKVKIASAPVREKFNQSLQESEALHDELTKQVQVSVKMQQEAKDKYLVP